MKFTFPVVFLLGLAFIAVPSPAQFYSTGEAPASTRWLQIKTPRYRIVFPAELRKDAFRLAGSLENTHALTSQSFSRPAKPMPVLLHNSSILSNGYVTWAPLRMELVATPPQDSYADDWISQLSLHEYRHAVQISQLKQGFTGALSVLSGEIGPGGISSMVPSWFYEGDAVVNETRNSQSGRGRVPGFTMPLRTLLLSGRTVFTYDKAVFGSYRDYVPNAYQYGYEMVSFSSSRWGDTFWPDALRYTARNPFFIWPLAFYLKKNSGVYKSGLYRLTCDSINNLYKNQEKAVTYINYLSKNKRAERDYTSYKLPYDLGKGNLVVLKTGIDILGQFTMIDSTGREARLVFSGSFPELKYDVSTHWMVWDEITSDPRWERRNFSEIRLMDLSTRKVHNLTRKTRYFSPDFSPDGERLAVVESDPGNTHFLTVIGTKSGQAVLRIPSPGNKALQFPEWTSVNRIAVITVSNNGKQIELVDLDNEQWRVILPLTRYDISELTHFRNYILFRSSYNGIENIYALDPDDSRLYQVTFSRFGAFNPSVSQDSTTLFFSDYSVQGHNVTGMPLDPASWKPVTGSSGPTGIWTGTRSGMIAGEETGPSGSYQWTVNTYQKATHLFNIHSWLPCYVPVTETPENLEDLPIRPGFMLFSQNLLSTAISSIGYYYSGTHHYLTPRFAWRGWYPVVEFSGLFGGPPRSLPIPDQVSVSGITGPYYEYSVRTYIPLLYNRGSYITYLQPMVEYQHASTYFVERDILRKGMDFFHYRLYLTRYLRMSERDLYPRAGGYMSATLTSTPADPGQFGSVFSLSAGAYIPGVVPHHHLVFRVGYQKQITDNAKFYLNINRISFPRGYPSAISSEFSALSADYAFPVVYPDLALGPVIYLKRLRADLFHDRSYGTDMRVNGQRLTGGYSSSGVELLADFHAARIIFPVSAGVRLGYRHTEKDVFAEFLLNIQSNIF